MSDIKIKRVLVVLLVTDIAAGQVFMTAVLNCAICAEAA